LVYVARPSGQDGGGGRRTRESGRVRGVLRKEMKSVSMHHRIMKNIRIGAVVAPFVVVLGMD